MNTKSDTTKAKGFTLIEVMCVITIVGLLMTLTIPPFARFIDSSRLRGASSELMGDIHFTRSLAMARRRTYRIEFQASRYRIIEDSTNDVVRTRTMPQGFVIAATTDPRFFAWGLTETANFKISKGTAAKNLILTSNGNVSCN